MSLVILKNYFEKTLKNTEELRQVELMKTRVLDLNQSLKWGYEADLRAQQKKGPETKT